MKKTTNLRRHLARNFHHLLIVLCFTLTACAALKKVVKSVTDIAIDACQLFGTEHPDEFRYLVAQQLGPQAGEKAAFSVKEACAIAEVVKPFLDQQMALQREQSQGLRSSMNREASGADLPQ